MKKQVIIVLPGVERQLWPLYTEGSDGVVRIRPVEGQSVPHVEIYFEKGSSTTYIGVPFIYILQNDEEQT